VGALVLLVAIDLYSFARPFMVTFDPSDHVWNEEIIRGFQKESQPFRVLKPHRRAPLFWRPDDVPRGVARSHRANVPSRFHDFFWTLQGSELDRQRTEFWYRPRDPKDTRLPDLASVKYVVGGDSRENLRVLPNTSAMPRAWLTHEVVIARDRAQALELLPTLDFGRHALLEEPLAEPLGEIRADEPLPVFTRYEPNYVAVRGLGKDAGAAGGERPFLSGMDGAA